MQPTDLPSEIQFNYLLRLSPQEIRRYCQVNKQAQTICESSYFWNEKARHDFGYSMDLLCQMHPYWQYWFVNNLSDSMAVISPLIRAGNNKEAEEIMNNPYANISRIIADAVESDDIVTLRYFQEYIEGMDDIYYAEDPFYYWLQVALLNGSEEVFNYLISLRPIYLEDTIILSELLEELHGHQLGLTLLRPHIQQMVDEYFGDEDVYIEKLRDYLNQ